MPAIKVLTHTT